MLRKALNAGKALLRDESGQTMLEYIVIVVLVVIAAMAAFRIISGVITDATDTIESEINAEL